MTDKTPSDIAAEINSLKVDLARSLQQPFQDAVTALQSDVMKDTLTKLTTIAETVGPSSTVSVQINNLINTFTNCANAINREAQGIAATLAASTASADSTPAAS